MKNLEKRDGKIVIHHPEQEYKNGKFIIHSRNKTIEMGENGKQDQNEEFKKTLEKEYSHCLSSNEFALTSHTSVLDSNCSKKKKEKQKKKKKQKKVKKKLQKWYRLIEEADIDAKKSSVGAVLSEGIKLDKKMAVIDENLYLYDESKGNFVLCGRNETQTKLKSLLSKREQLKVKTNDYKEAYNQLMISEEIQKDNNFFENKPLVNCLNGVYDPENNELIKHSSDYFFKYCVNAKYIAEATCPLFMEYLEYTTNKNNELMHLIQVMLGYLFSSYNNAKTAFLLYGVPHSGKSVLCKVISEIIGNQYTTNVDLAKLSRPEYAARLENAMVNIAPDLPNEPIKDTGFFKSLISHDDVIEVRCLYGNPHKLQGKTKMVFASNHLLKLENASSMDIEAVFNRLIYIPFEYSVSKEEEDHDLSSKLMEEKEGIFSWAMKGLQDYIASGEKFPECDVSKQYKLKNLAKCLPEKQFFEECIKFTEEKYECTSVIKESFKNFCAENGIGYGKLSIVNYLINERHFTISRVRIDNEGNRISHGNPQRVIKGLRIKSKYRVAV